MAQVQLPLPAPLLISNAPATTAASSSGAGGSANPSPFLSSSLYVGDLHPNVTDAQLYALFCQVALVVSVRLCRDNITGRSLGYAYVNFTNQADAAKALKALNCTLIYGKPIRIMYSNRNPSLRKSGIANLIVKNLNRAIDSRALQDTFSEFGNILSCKIETFDSGRSKGFGFVQFDREEAAINAIEKLNGTCLNGKPIYVGHFRRKQERGNTSKDVKFSNVFVKNLAESTTEDDVKKIFGKFGGITSAVVMKGGDGKSKCFGFVNFENPDDAALAVNNLNGKKFDGKEWYVGKALKKDERSELSNREMANLFLKNLDESIGDEKLKELFSEFGTVTSCKVLRDPNGASKGSGFVAFSTAGEASRALLEMNGKMIGDKALYVAIAQRKEQRRAQLQGEYGPIGVDAMILALANASPAQQRIILGERLYPLVDRVEHENAAMVTGMILEMEQTEVLHLLESDEDLRATVAEAMEVLMNLVDAPGLLAGVALDGAGIVA